MRKGYEENLLKRFLKRKVKVTLGMVVAFLITGTMGYGAEAKDPIVKDDHFEFTTQKEGEQFILEKDYIFKNGATIIGAHNQYTIGVGPADDNNSNYLTKEDKKIIVENGDLVIKNTYVPKGEQSTHHTICSSEKKLTIDAKNSMVDISTVGGFAVGTGGNVNQKGTIEIFSKNTNLSGDSGISAIQGEVKVEATEKITIDAIIKSSYPPFENGRGIDAEVSSRINLIADKIEIEASKIGIYSSSSSKVTVDSNSYISSENGYSLFVNNGDITLTEKGNHEIHGNISASKAGNIVIKGKGNNIFSLNNKIQEVKAEYSGITDIDLTEGFLKGRVNDCRVGYNVGDSGTVKLNLDNGIWESQGKGSVTEINLTNGGNIKFIDKNSSIDIKNLTGNGNGTFVMNINSENKEEGNMLYVQNSEGGQYTVDFQNSDLSKIKVGDKIRFATIGKDAKDKNLEFKVTDIKERGIKNISFEVGNENFDINNAENKIYNEGTNKSGNDYVEENYINGENWFVTREESTDEDINDGGLTVIEMARANYSSAVYMDNLNKRLGDMTFANGNSGIWVRTRNDRVGEDNEYRLHNYMTQIGYDKIYPLENGTEYRGIAFDYADGQMEYKNLEGESDIDRYTVTLYDTRLYNSGVYADYTVRAGYMESEFDIRGRETGNQVKGDYDNLILGVGAEFGKRYDFGETSYFEPQIQLQYTYIDDTDYTTNQDTKVNYDEIHSLIGRAGIRLGHDFYKENSKDNTVYLKIDANHEFLGDQDVKAQDLTGTLNETYHNDNTWYDIGIGGAKNLTEDLYVYADMERQFGHKDNSWQFNLGFRYKFGSLKDFTFNTTNLFDFDKSIVKPEGKEMIKNASQIIDKKKLKGTLVIEGHTDWTGTEEYNQILSEKRAKAVREEFESNITNENIKYESKGYGETKPIATNRTKEGRAKNRRVDIKYIKD